ncbi:LOW QUALITY PROTEIN: PABIR family member 1 [Orycteropus afer afer]|uniref:LOW QUALITY PROTEIN: PABIR family member 1 n=1 Tax=Orycteropus afer afer TaxID=1230840 RepID=A0A8B7AMA6_ORYAF|nr:LOW QUALITY PROTEIN: PABIR family member 1 [Orycteropus afer afer]
MEQERMELDLDLLPTSTTTDSNILRRSSSEPLISGLGDNSQVFQADTLRTRRNSTSFMSQQSLLMPPSPFQNSIGQLNEVKQEESMDFLDREATCEQEIQASIQINQFWEENLNLVKWHLKIIHQRGFSRAQPTCFLLILPSCQIQLCVCPRTLLMDTTAVLNLLISQLKSALLTILLCHLLII